MRWYATCGQGSSGFCGSRDKLESGWTHDEYQLELVEERPANCVTVFFIMILRGLSFYQSVPNEGVHR